jgi:hypothetical protein
MNSSSENHGFSLDEFVLREACAQMDSKWFIMDSYGIIMDS